MSGEWQDSNELIESGIIAIDQFEVMAGSAIVGGGMVRAVMVRVTGVMSENVGVPDAERVTTSFLIPQQNAEQFAEAVVQASRINPQ